MSFGELLKDITALLSEANKLDKNKQQQYFLRELRSINRKLLKQGQTQKRNLILGIIFSSIASGFFGYLLTDDGRENFLILIGYIPHDGVYDDDTYKSYSAGFYMIKPSPSWTFGPIESLETISTGRMWEHPHFIDGTALENSSTTVFMTAFAHSKEFLSGQTLEDYFNNLNFMVNFARENISERVSVATKGDWAEKESIHLIDGRQQLERYKIQLYNDRLYIMHSVLWDPDKALEKDKKDFEDVWNSFRFCSSSVNCND